MSADESLLVLTALSVGFLHTLLGPDHYIPFVAMARSHGWSAKRTLGITTLCGLGHVAGSVVIGGLGLLLGTLLFRLEAIEAFRGDTAAWLLIGFGLAYLVWGLVRAYRNLPHTHLHSHVDGTVHKHLHQHDLQHRHVHDNLAAETTAGRRLPQLTPWLLFLIFAFGPCEVLIPLLMYPAAEANVLAIVAVVVAFSAATILTMVVTVMGMVYGLELIRIPAAQQVNWQRYSHALAGFAVLMCGVLVKFGF